MRVNSLHAEHLYSFTLLAVAIARLASHASRMDFRD